MEAETSDVWISECECGCGSVVGCHADRGEPNMQPHIAKFIKKFQKYGCAVKRVSGQEFDETWRDKIGFCEKRKAKMKPQQSKALEFFGEPLSKSIGK